MNTRPLRQWSLPALLLALLMAPTGFGQSTSGSITGTVKDNAGAPIADASVTITNPGTNLAVPQANGAFATGNAIFASYGQVVITNNLRGGPVEGSTVPLGQRFGEYSGARDPRILQLAVKINF